MQSHVTIIGAGLAGCEAALYLSSKGVKVTLIDQKPIRMSPAHSNEGFAELVCSNSLGAERVGSASGLLKEETRRLGGRLFDIAKQHAVPAGGALAVERSNFSKAVEEAVKSSGVEVVHRVVDEIVDGICIVATGPMTELPFADVLQGLTGGFLSYHDAAAPIVTAESLKKEYCFAASRYGRGGDDYINCPLNKEEYYAFVKELVNAERAPLHDFDRVYEGCMPIEILAQRGEDSLRYGPFKPVGLTDPVTGRRPYANLQLRREDAQGNRYNLVGCQTNLKFGEQRRVFGMISALSGAEYVRYGVMHRNSFINSPMVLNDNLSLKGHPNVFIAGGITGFEGYSESISCGILAARFVYDKISESETKMPPPETMVGGLLRHVLTVNKNFQPQGAAMGLIPPLSERIKDKKMRYEKIAERSLKALDEYISAL